MLFPKRFLHQYIHSKLKVTYNKIRKIVLNDRLIYFPQQIIYYGFKFIIQKIKKIILKIQNKRYNQLSSHHVTSKDDLYNLREVLGHKNEIVERFLLNYINDNECKKYLNYLYDCIDLKVDGIITDDVGAQLCRLVNLQIMLNAKDDHLT